MQPHEFEHDFDEHDFDFVDEPDDGTDDEGRDIVVVDTETTGLNPEKHIAVEVAYWNLRTGANGVFVPRHDVRVALELGDPDALRINRYTDRLQYAEQDHGDVELTGLYRQLKDSALAGANPAFDARFLSRMFRRLHIDGEPAMMQPWHHRMPDLATYAAGALRTPLGKLAGLGDVCEALGIENLSPHTAAGDVNATGECFLALEAYCGQIDELVEASEDLITAQGEDLPEVVVRLLALLQGG